MHGAGKAGALRISWGVAGGAGGLGLQLALKTAQLPPQAGCEGLSAGALGEPSVPSQSPACLGLSPALAAGQVARPFLAGAAVRFCAQPAAHAPASPLLALTTWREMLQLLLYYLVTMLPGELPGDACGCCSWRGGEPVLQGSSGPG